ncbi:putative methyltransferase-domain-containing protein [Lactarius akahatsu]|uniref:Protein-lysine N-methyltransferase EFM6 n=1 Tax=Lactarius akahatsu TaxID=416441 RepID=A0AAD4LCX7_9AGAM|nr:putative methyltransferase-domain-containing protein [Lactarius akahatsu]
MSAIATSCSGPEPLSLDIIDPLHHLASSDDPDLLPAHPPSLRDQIIQINIRLPLDTDEFQRSISLPLAVDASPGCGGIAWPAGEVLACYIARRGKALQGLNVLELGSGTGLVGLVAGYFGARVYITDQAPLIPIMERNIALSNLQSNVTAAELDWSKPLPEHLPQPDIVLAADCVYFEPAFPLLVATLVALVPPPHESAPMAPEVLFCYKKRRKADKRFFAILKKQFTWSVVDDDPARETYDREAITLLRLFRRP